MPLSLSIRNPDLVARVDDSLERARAAAGLPPSELSRLGGVGIDAVAAAAVNETHVRFGSGLESIIQPEQRDAFERAFESYAELYKRIGLTPPTPEDYAAAGIDFVALASKWQAEEGTGHAPEIVLAPSDLPPESWEQLFQSLQHDPTVNKDGAIKNGGLYINDEVRKAWDGLNTVPAGVTTATSPSLSGKECQWTIRIIPGTDRPTNTGIDHDGRRNNDESKQDILHPTIVEYLALQAESLAQQRVPVDADTYTWLQGTLAGGSQAPYGDWSPDLGLVELFWYYSVLRYDDLGVRPPVW